MRSISASLLLVVLAGLVGARDLIDSPMYRIPDLDPPEDTTSFPPGIVDLWLKALKRPEVDLRGRATVAITLGKQRGVPGLEATIRPLQELLDREEEHPTVRLGAARALIELDAQSAEVFMRRTSAGDLALRELIEPALARWKHPESREMWLKRLEQSDAGLSELRLAIRGLASTGDGRANDRILGMLLNKRLPTALRLEAAQGLGQLRNQGLESHAAQLAGSTGLAGLSERIAAARLLQRHNSPEAIALLQKLLADEEPAVAYLASQPLLQADPRLLLGELEKLRSSRDARLRRVAAQTLARLPTEQHLAWLGDLLADVHPEVRVTSRQEFSRLATQKELRAEVINQAMRLLAGNSWQGQEQSTTLLTQLEHKPAAMRLVELLPAVRWEAFLTAAWGLRKLAVPETLPGVTRHVEEELNRMTRNKPLPGRKPDDQLYVDLQLSQLNQLLGQQKYQPAEKLLRQFVPRLDPLYVPESRAAALWALGFIHEGKNVPALASEAAARLQDVSSIPPEDPRVRKMAALLLGRMKAKEQLEDLRFFAGIGEPIGLACHWAIEQITGEKRPPVPLFNRRAQDWFLQPVK